MQPDIQTPPPSMPEPTPIQTSPTPTAPKRSARRTTLALLLIILPSIVALLSAVLFFIGLFSMLDTNPESPTRKLGETLMLLSGICAVITTLTWGPGLGIGIYLLNSKPKPPFEQNTPT